jgi:UDP-glucose 4-epimerase
LARNGHDIAVIDQFPTERHRSIQLDLRDAAARESALDGADFVCHLAAIGDVYLAGDNPALAAETNVVATVRLCEAMLKAGVERLVYASTWEVYGEPRYQPMDEEHPCTPEHPYSITKLAGEQLALAHHRMRGLQVSALRLGTAYGTRMRPNSVFSLFIDRALRGEAITIQGTGEQGRQFTHARDIGAAFGAALRRAEAGPVYNIVSERMVSVRELAEHVVRLIPTKIEFAPARKAEIPSALVSNARARKELQWIPSVTFEDGMRELVEERSRLTASAGR